MQKAGMTQTALAMKAGTSQGYISELLSLTSTPTIEVVSDLAHAFGMQPWELLMDTDAARSAVWAKVVWGSSAPNERVGETYKPAPPSKPTKPKKTGGKRGKRKEKGD